MLALPLGTAGSYILKIEVWLKDYPNARTSQLLNMEVDECQPTKLEAPVDHIK